MSEDGAKRAAGEAAAALVQDGMVVGLGTGSTMRPTVAALGRRVREENLRITGVPTSSATAGQAQQLGIRLAEPSAPIDIALDGADEVEAGTLRLIKGGGGALLREKIVAESSRRFVVVADNSKLVQQLGRRMPLPVEVVGYGMEATSRRIAALGGTPVLRRSGDAAFRTDNGNLILDCTGFAPILDPFTLDRALRAIAGVVVTGLFLMPIECVLLGASDGSVQELRPR